MQVLVAHIQPVYQYRLNDADVIVDVDRWWLAFARENNASELNETSVIGRVLWEFISDTPTQLLYKEIHAHVRFSGRPVTVPFRCDSPTLQRHMQLTISRHDAGGLCYQSKLIRATPQHHVAMFDRTRKRSSAFLTMCSFCKRSLIEPAGWLEMENISLNLRMYERQTVPELRYTVCPRCAKTLKQTTSAASNA